MALTNVGAPLTVGGAIGKGSAKGNFGATMSPMYIYEVTPAAAVTNGIAASQAVSGASNLTLNGSLVTAGVAVFDIARTVQAVSTVGTDTTQTLTFTGTDFYSVPVVETVTMNGTNIVQGLKAFKTVNRVASSGSFGGSVTAGSGDKFGIPFRINKKGSLQAFWDNTWNNASGTTTIAVTTTPATATTGDVRGTYTTATASDATRTLAFWVYMDDVDSNNGLYGVDQFGG